MPTPPTNPPVLDVRNRLSAFTQWRQQNLRGDEKGEAQVFLDRLFQAFGWEGVYEAGATLEYRIAKTNGGTSFADLLWKPRVLIEMKKAGTDLSRHFRQAFDYWVRAVPDRPRYVILCNFDQFWVYDFENQIDQPVEKIPLDKISDRWESLGFMMPREVEPIFNNDLVAVTREAAADVAKVFVSLRDRGVPAAEAQRFALQCVMAMFAEDIGLLPEHFFTRAVEEATTGAEAYDLIGGLFREMNTPGRTRGGRFAGTPYFNGGLFKEVMPQELDHREVLLLREAARTVWSDVRPEIFGTLFEGSMDAGERHASGAHFTTQADIARIVGPVIIQPWRERIDLATNIDQLNAILEAMSQYRVLDPSVGSGNFLYVAYREMRRLEREVIEKIRERRTSDQIAAQESFGYVTPEQFFGMDINPFAIEVAKVTMLLGKKLADDEMHEIGQTLPLNNLDRNYIVGDALFTPWPAADAIIGNPPYLGRRKMVQELGAAYVSDLDAKYGPRGVSDFVTYWFPLAHDHLPIGGRAGFVATKSIKQGDGRKVSLDYIVDRDGVIIDAVSSMPWSGVANVHISIVNWQKGGSVPDVKTLWMAADVEPLMLAHITAALSPDINLKDARKLRANQGSAFQGQTNNVKSAFEPSPFDARLITRSSDGDAKVVHPLLGGKVMLHSLKSTDRIIDIPVIDADIAWRDFPASMARLEKLALPVLQERADLERQANDEAFAQNSRAKVNTHKQDAMKRWWILWRRRPDYLTAVERLDRYIAVNRTASGNRTPVFAFIDGRFRVNDSIIAYPFDDDYSFGILQSAVHEIWFRARGTTLGTAPRFGSGVYPSFPWPQKPEASSVDAVASAASALVAHTGKAFDQGYALAKQYDVLRHPGASTLRSLKEALDLAVLDAYGFDRDEPLLDQIFELNLLVSQRESNSEPVTAAGPQTTSVISSHWKWPLPSE